MTEFKTHPENLKLSVLVLDFKKPEETRLCLESIKNCIQFPHEVVYLDNGSGDDYPWQYYKEGLCDILISKKKGDGGGFGQTDLIRYCRTEYFIFMQNDQAFSVPISKETFEAIKNLLDKECQCVSLNGGVNGNKWSDRTHCMRTEVFNNLKPFPNGAPGLDSIPWNEEYISKKFDELGYKILVVNPPLIVDNGKWSIREAGDGLYKHRCDSKALYILKKPTYKTEVYPPFNSEEWTKALNGEWKDGDVPEQWKPHVFRYWKD